MRSAAIWSRAAIVGKSSFATFVLIDAFLPIGVKARLD